MIQLLLKYRYFLAAGVVVVLLLILFQNKRKEKNQKKETYEKRVKDQILNEIEDEAYTVGKAGREISTAQLGEIVLKRLNSLDKVAYIRFASVYRKFNNLEEFIEEVKKISL